MRKRIGNCIAIGLLLGSFPALSTTAAPPATAQPTHSADARLREGLQKLSAGDASAAAELLADLVEDSPAGLDQKTAFTAVGKAYSALQDHSRACDAFESALMHASEPAEVTVLRLAAADAALRSDKPDDAIAHCKRTFDSELSPKQRQLAIRTCLRAHLSLGTHDGAQDLLEREWAEYADDTDPSLAEFAIRIGTASLRAKDVETAFRSYEWYLSHANDGPSLQVAELGLAWAAALGAETPERAARRMQAFLDRFPESPDRAAVLQAEAACWRQAGRHDEANQPLHRLIREQPGTAAALRALDQLSDQTHDDQSELAVQARQTAVRDAGGKLTPSQNVLAAAIRDAAAQKDEDFWQLCIDQSLDHAAAGEIVADALVRLSHEKADAYAERLCAQVLRRLGDAAAASATESVTQWAADSGRWSMLALSSDKHDPEELIPKLSAPTSRLIAEAFMQAGRSSEAKKWYDGAVEQHGLSDFASLLRRAELAVALDPLPLADERVAAAKAAARNESDRTVVEILTAEQLIRRAKLDESRAILQRIVRWDEANLEVRCRAQWLVGETFLMQQRYPDAVDAYRRVEVLDGSGRWAPAALVQAGKAFEKMGRPREASVCYSGLLQRFADSEHASVARDRLATMRKSTSLR